MNPRITSIENLIAADPGGRNVFDLMVSDQLELAARSLELAQRVAVVSGFYVPEAGAGETDGPSGAKVLGEALRHLEIPVDYVTDVWNTSLFRAIGIVPVVECVDYLQQAKPTHLVAVERLGRGNDGRYRNMRGRDVTDTTAPLDDLFLNGNKAGLTTIGIGDGGNEIGMGKVFSHVSEEARGDPVLRTIVATDFCIAAGVSNWGAYGLAGALSILAGRDLLPTAKELARDIEKLVEAGAVDGVTHRRQPTVDGMELAMSLRMLEEIRRQIVPSPLSRVTAPLQAPFAGDRRADRLRVGVLGYGESGAAAAALLCREGHRVRVSDAGGITVGTDVRFDGVETGGHTIEFLEGCDLVVASPGVRLDNPIGEALHRRGLPVMSELEMAFQLCDREVIAVTGTVGKRSTVVLMSRLFDAAGVRIAIGGNKGRPLSALLLDENLPDLIALAVSSFQLESVVHLCPNVAAILNIDEAHLDRHRTLAEYIRIKSRIFMNQGHQIKIAPAVEAKVRDVLILPFDDVRLRSLARKHRGRTYFVSARQSLDRGAWLLDGRVYVSIEGVVEELGPVDPPGRARPVHYVENLLTSVVAGRLYGVDADRLGESIRQLRASGGIL